MDAKKEKNALRCHRFHLDRWPGFVYTLVCCLSLIYGVAIVLDSKYHDVKTRAEIDSLRGSVRELKHLIGITDCKTRTSQREKRSLQPTSTPDDLVEIVLKTIRHRCSFGKDFCDWKGEQGLPGPPGPRGFQGDKGESGLKGERGSKGDRGRMVPTLYALPVRLTGGSNEWEGRVEVYHNGVWGTVCDNHWDIIDAGVVCRQLNRGYNGAVAAKRGAFFGRGSGRVWMDNLQCIGTENSLSDCSFRGWGLHQCNHSQDAGVVCVGDIRLVDGLKPEEGRVEVFQNGTWGTVCNKSWNVPDADVACRQLGYFGAKSHLQSAYDQQGSGEIRMNNLDCTGDENHLSECLSSGWSSLKENCNHTNDAGLSCISDIRLNKGAQREEGRVEVLYNGTWGAVCDDRWDFNDAHVACRQLGYVRAKEYKTTSFYGEGDTIGVWMANLDCVGSEQHLEECRFSGWKISNNCSHTAGVVCVADIRLVSGALPEEGRVEVRHEGVWGTVCDHDWDLNDAHVACRQLGYVRARAYEVNSLFGKGSGVIWMSEVSCTGSESRLGDCFFGGWEKHNCTHRNDAGIRCVSDIRLTGRNSINSGFVEVLHNGTWGGVCYHGWDKSNAHVACRQLGYYRAREYELDVFSLSGARVASDTWMSRLHCKGTESRLDRCTFLGWGVHKGCSRSVASRARITCSENVRLIGGLMPYEGRVQVLHNGVWGTICDSSWEATDAHVVCQELGYYRVRQHVYSEFKKHTSGPVWLGQVHCSGLESSIRVCKSDGWGKSQCDHSRDVGVVCANPLVRLKGPYAPRVGQLQVHYHGIWGTVCNDDGWSGRLDNAQVLCRELGFPGADAVFSTGSSPAISWMSKVICKGHETNFTDCRYAGGKIQECDFGMNVGVACKAAVRLAGHLTSTEGRVEVYHDGFWGTVCDDHWDWSDAHVVCKHLGFPTATAAIRGSRYGQGTGPTWMSRVSCKGHESNLTDCNFSGWGIDDCGHDRDAGVICTRVRLSNGTTSNEGRVEVYRAGRWGTVCDDTWNFAAAHVVCKELGFPTASDVRRGGAFGYGTGPMWMSGVYCQGHETNLTECRFRGWGVVDGCHHNQLAGVVCKTIRLSSSFSTSLSHMGRVEVYHKGVWGTVCDSDWDLDDGRVICKELGFPAVSAVRRRSFFGEGSGPIWMSDVACKGDERNITRCKFLGWGVGSCSHRRDAGVVCATLRLVNGSESNEGRVEVYHDGAWGTVCGDVDWDIIDANVVCRELDFPSASAVRLRAHFGQGSGSVWLGGVACNGQETNLTHCRFRGWGLSSCSHRYDAGVVCRTVRLRDGRMQNEGRVEVYHDGSWGTVCDDNWDFSDAHVTCRQLGFPTAASVKPFGPGTGNIWMDEVNCEGNETDIAQCDFPGWALEDCNHDEDAGVVCATVMLSGQFAVSRGRVELYYNGTWGRVCNDEWNIGNSHVVCRELGFPSAKEVGSYSGPESLPMLFSGIACKGNEKNLTDCRFRKCSNLGKTCCRGKDAAAVTCSTIRLAGGSAPYEGRVEVYRRGQWGTVGDTDWSLQNAHVACIELGFSLAIKAHLNAYFGRGTGIVWMDRVSCRAKTKFLSRCLSGCSPCSKSSHSDDAGVSCGTVRLVGGISSNEGRMEVYHKGQWGRVCGGNWNWDAAHSACRELGFPAAASIRHESRFGTGLGTTWMNEITCTGMEPKFADCSFSGWKNEKCDQDAGLTCTSVRLVGTSARHEGRVEVYHKGEWGTVCHDAWDFVDAHVVCRELGFRTAAHVRLDSYYGRGYGPIWMDDVACTGKEANLTACDFPGWEVDDCNHKEDAGVVCETNLRLVGGTGFYEGRVEVNIGGEWGTVCDEGWDMRDAHVVCRQLGYLYATSYKTSAYYGTGSGRIWMSNVDCSGSERKISSCTFEEATDRQCSHSEDAGVSCFR